MAHTGLFDACRYSYPPNSLSLCGPDKKKDMAWYSMSGEMDGGTSEILSGFGTLYPYLCHIAYENNIRDPFSKEVIEAYFLGNNLLANISKRKFADHLSTTLQLKKKLEYNKYRRIITNLDNRALPHHSFHVLNIYKRTGHMDIPQTIQTMDACLINWGVVKKVEKESMTIATQALQMAGDKLRYGKIVERKIRAQGKKDLLFEQVKIDDTITYHWGYFCQKINKRQLTNLIYYTRASIQKANQMHVLH